MCLFKSWGKRCRNPFFRLVHSHKPQANTTHALCIMHVPSRTACGAINHMSMHFLTAYVYCMSSSIHSARDAPSKRSSTQPDVRTYTTTQTSTKHQIAHNTQRAPAQITRNVLRPFPHGQISRPDNPIGSVRHRDRPIAIYPL
jgi:hypothetical protein